MVPLVATDGTRKKRSVFDRCFIRGYVASGPKRCQCEQGTAWENQPSCRAGEVGSVGLHSLRDLGPPYFFLCDPLR